MFALLTSPVTAGPGSIPGPGLLCSYISQGKSLNYGNTRVQKKQIFIFIFLLKQVWVFKRIFLLVYEICYQYTYKPQEEWLASEISEKTQLRRPLGSEAQLSLIR